jgi:hypothetical protein
MSAASMKASIDIAVVSPRLVPKDFEISPTSGAAPVLDMVAEAVIMTIAARTNHLYFG